MGLPVQVKLNAGFNATVGQSHFIIAAEVAIEGETLAAQDHQCLITFCIARPVKQGMRLIGEVKTGRMDDEHFIQSGGVWLKAWDGKHGAVASGFKARAQRLRA